MSPGSTGDPEQSSIPSRAKDSTSRIQRRHRASQFPYAWAALWHRLRRSWPFGVQGSMGRTAAMPFSGRTMVLRVRCQRGYDRSVALPRPPHAYRGRGRTRAVRRHRRARPACEKADLESPFFFHKLTATSARPVRQRRLNAGDLFTFTFPQEGTFDTTAAFIPCRDVCESPPAGRRPRPSTSWTPRRGSNSTSHRWGGWTVTWTHAGNQPHTVTDAAARAWNHLPSTAAHCRQHADDRRRNWNANPLVRVQPGPGHDLA